MGGVEHVIVLMLENRSFDHMLGFLDHPSRDFPKISTGNKKFSNPKDPTNLLSETVYVSKDADTFLDPDPPHSHVSILEQIHVRGLLPPKMDGFISAYRRKAAGDEEGRPHIYWWRITLVALAVILLLSSAFGVLASFGFGPIVAGGALGFCLWIVLKREIPEAGIPTRWILIPPLGMGVLAWAIGVYFEMLQTVLWVVSIVLGLALITIGWKRLKHRRLPEHAPDVGPNVMKCMDPEGRLPCLATLAKEFAVFTNWHCSVPGATWPNRNFVHSGSSDGTVDIEVDFYDNETIFDRLEKAGKTWRIYHDGMAQLCVFKHLWDPDERRVNWYEFSKFFEHLPNLPTYTFIEPCHDGQGSNSQHPGNNDENIQYEHSDFRRGDVLIGSIYRELVKHPDLFAKTAFVITYDEHGGLYDHVSPPTNAINPIPLTNPPTLSGFGRCLAWFVEQPDEKALFKFNVLGPRVPTVVVSPLIPAGTVEPMECDHTAIPATIRKRFAPGSKPLSAREEASPTFEKIFSLPQARTDLPSLSDFMPTEFGVLEEIDGLVPVRDDEFAEQLDELEQKMGPLLPQAEAVADFGPLEEGVVEDSIPSRFAASAEQARTRLGGS